MAAICSLAFSIYCRIFSLLRTSRRPMGRGSTACALPAPLDAVRPPLWEVAPSGAATVLMAFGLTCVGSAMVFLLMVAPQERLAERQKRVRADGGADARHQAMIKV